MAKQKFKSTRDQQVDGKHIKQGATVEVEADRVAYLVARGYLVEAAPAKKKKAPAKTEGEGE